jgi:hypothetical protein
MNTEFMDKVEKQLLESGLAQTSVNLYLQQYKTLAGGPFKNTGFLKDIENIMKTIEPYGVSTQKTYLSAIVALLSLAKRKTPLLDTYKQILDKKIAEYNETSKNRKTEKEQQNWMSQEDINTLKEDLKKQVEEFKGGKINSKQWDKLQSLLLISLYTEIPPRRNQDYQYCYVVKSEKDLEQTKNYLISPEHKFIFQKYKTSKKEGKQEISFADSEDLKEVIRIYLQHHPLNRGKKSNDYPLIVDANGEPYKPTNSITRLLNRAFKKKVGSSLLRKIYLTNKYGDKLDLLDDMRKTASQMGHSVSTAQNVYIKK